MQNDYSDMTESDSESDDEDFFPANATRDDVLVRLPGEFCILSKYLNHAFATFIIYLSEVSITSNGQGDQRMRHWTKSNC